MTKESASALPAWMRGALLDWYLALPDREWAIWTARMLADRPASQASLADGLGITRARVGQIEARLLAQARSLGATDVAPRRAKRRRKQK